MKENFQLTLLYGLRDNHGIIECAHNINYVI
jgi:hypothetical protein